MTKKIGLNKRISPRLNNPIRFLLLCLPKYAHQKKGCIDLFFAVQR